MNAPLPSRKALRERLEDAAAIMRARFLRWWKGVDGWVDTTFGGIDEDASVAHSFKSDAEALEEAPVPRSAHVALYTVLAILVVMILPQLAHRSVNGRGPWCENNLLQIGLAYREWADDHNGKYPFEVSVTSGGTKELNNGRNAWLNFLVMSNELSTPRVLVCPEDKMHLPAAINFSSQLAEHVSYFVGLDARRDKPQRVLSGDDNLIVNGIPVRSGMLNLSTNASVKWTTERHHGFGNTLLAGGYVFKDAVVQSPPPPFQNLQQALEQSGLATNRFAIP